ncbi:type II secretory pathway, ATPase PulE/Tfp pilus assembly pathway, ATPase PilB [Rivularia sp. PCC 7116]|uniref:type II secretory pathway, ATPase PulE/Tfp pilus assembly pathway, ATPase PilB n=1 Tax=Rivularia sp. PCC 7116 TaxID=373994 RepID=UPI00029F0236|nr:type II secretory pathway, ATPase PulE/Tfp pilus assembly pathway, ATPase PilB [Rivularia sp. PCC 7116]AFY57947.1 type II secretory pathway, ATPase PulE/Tfp pilus assembly pathway, ATPase PilB [Rivularia sp. PCC 7116]
MLSSEGKPTDTSSANANHKPSKTIGTDGASSLEQNQQLEREQIFRLIEEGILCFEACLYHQILPLKLEYNSLLLGIVNPKDTVALDYVNSILSYLKIRVITRTVSADTHRIILSEYLNHKNACEESKLHEKETQVDSNNSQNNPAKVVNRLDVEDSEEESQPGDNTLILFDSSAGANFKNLSAKEIKKPPVGKPLKSDKQNTPENTGADIFEIISAQNIPLLRLPLPESFNADETLSMLPPKQLLNELLARILEGGIGRLYLERQPYQGRILWSLNGIVQSVVEELPLSAFQGVLNELKRLGSLPIRTLSQAKQVEIECLYQKQRLLLRLRVMLGVHGEEATLQVLRGAALKFYQQQQLTRLSRDALGASQQLNYKVRELQQRLTLNKRELNPQQSQALDSLSKLIDNLDHHLRILTEISNM